MWSSKPSRTSVPRAQVFFTVANGNFQGFGGGTIGGDALIDVGAVNFSTGPLSDDIYNYLGGRIGHNASINVALSGALSVQGDTLFRILNYGNSDGLEGGQIGENATISVAAASIQAASLLAEINNSQGGQIGGSASINVFASGAVVVTNDATFCIDGSDGATSAAVNFNGGNYNVGGTCLGYIDGNGTFTLNNATIAAETVKSLRLALQLRQTYIPTSRITAPVREVTTRPAARLLAP